jgi:ABC-type branched-subunit amino acid transport system substrate-binding protein
MYLSAPGRISERLGTQGRRFVREYAPTQPGAEIREFAVYAAAATDVLLDAIARSDGTRASVTRQLLATHLADSPIGPISFTPAGDLVHPVITIMRIRARSGVSHVPTFEGAAFDRVIAPPPSSFG